MHHVSVVDTDLTRDKFTQHGLHLNSTGKELIAKTVGQTITTYLRTGKPAISLNWKEVPLTTPMDEPKTNPASKSDQGEHGNVVKTSCRTKRPQSLDMKIFYG
jgi:hypothetical protein